MRNPSSLLAIALVCASPLFAVDLPSWTSVDEPWGSWRVVNFTDQAGQGHELWCRWGECGWNRTSGRAKLYVFERAGTEYYEYKEHFWSSPIKSSKTTYATMLSHYELDMTTKPHRAVVPGTDQAFPVEDRPQLTPTGYQLHVLAPSRVADDLPAPTTPQQPTKPQTPSSPHGSTTHHRSSSGHRSTPTQTRLVPHVVTDQEKKWLTFPEKSAYETALESHKAKTEPMRQLRLRDYRDARAKVATNLADREGADKKYPGMTSRDSVDAAAIDAYLDGLQPYSGDEIKLTDAELAKLDAIKDAAGASQKANYDKDMGAADANDAVLRHRIVAKYRPLVPSVQPTPAAGDQTGALTADEIDQLKRFGLWSDYQKDVAAANGDAGKLADVYKNYRQKIAAAAGTPPQDIAALIRSRLSGADLDAFIADLAKATDDASKNAVYDKYLAKIGPKVSNDELAALPIGARKPFCDRLKANSKGGSPDSPGAKTNQELARKIAACGTDQDCINHLMAGTGGTTVAAGGTGGGSLVASSPDLARLYSKCLNLDEQTTTPSGHTGGDMTAQIPPAPAADTATDPKKKGPDPNFWRNLSNGMNGALFGMILGSFFGGPLVMVGYAAVLGGGAYMLSKHLNKPKGDS